MSYMLLWKIHSSQVVPEEKKVVEIFFFPHYNGNGLIQVAMMNSGATWQKSAKN